MVTRILHHKKAQSWLISFIFFSFFLSTTLCEGPARERDWMYIIPMCNQHNNMRDGEELLLGPPITTGLLVEKEVIVIRMGVDQILFRKLKN